MTPPARLVGSIRFRVVSGVVGFVPCELRKRRPERSKNKGREGQKSCSNCFRKPLRRLWGRPGAPRGWASNGLVAFWSIFGRPGGGSGGPVGPVGALLGPRARFQSLFWGPRRVPRAVLDAFWGGAVAQEAPKAFPEASGSYFGSIFRTCFG